MGNRTNWKLPEDVKSSVFLVSKQDLPVEAKLLQVFIEIVTEFLVVTRKSDSVESSGRAMSKSLHHTQFKIFRLYSKASNAAYIFNELKKLQIGCCESTR